MQDVVRNRRHHIYNEDIYNKYIREIEEYSFLGDEIDMPDFYLKNKVNQRFMKTMMKKNKNSKFTFK